MYNAKFKENSEFYSFVFSNGFEYEIPKNIIKNTADVNEWLMHLRDKIWFTESLEDDFIGATVFNVED